MEKVQCCLLGKSGRLADKGGGWIGPKYIILGITELFFNGLFF